MDSPSPPGNYVWHALELFARYGDTEAIVQGDARRTYTDVRDATLSLARILYGQGLRAGTAVALLSRDDIESAALHLALHLLGCRTVWITTYVPVSEQAKFVQLAEPDVLIYSVTPARQRLAEELTAGLGPVQVLSLGPGGQGMDLIAGLAAAAGQRDSASQFDPAVAGPSPESLFYTGGTTGRPKLVRHGQDFYRALLDIAAYYVSIGEPPMRFFFTTSFTHVSGQMPALLTLFGGGTLVIPPGWEPAAFLTMIEKERINSVLVTPWQLYQLVDHIRAVGPACLGDLRYLNVGGAAASPARLADGIEVLGPVIRLVYGLSEAPLVTDQPFLELDPEHPERLASCGRPFLDTRIEIRDDAGAVLPAGRTGQVWVTGSLTMDGYWGEPGLTSRALVDGWLRTGDIGYLDAGGYLYLVDRASDVIITSDAAANVYARPIEDALMCHPAVRAAAVIGVPDEEFGEAVHAVVVTTPGAVVTGEDLRRLAGDRLNELFTPREVEFADSLPMTALGKIDKKVLRERYRAGPGRPGAAARPAGRP